MIIGVFREMLDVIIPHILNDKSISKQDPISFQREFLQEIEKVLKNHLEEIHCKCEKNRCKKFSLFYREYEDREWTKHQSSKCKYCTLQAYIDIQAMMLREDYVEGGIKVIDDKGNLIKELKSKNVTYRPISINCK
jgi:hypothetical protein